MPLVTAFLAGLLFGCGLVLSGMTNPGKVLAFLDLAGQWDPSLLFVMVGAILVAAPRLPSCRRARSHAVRHDAPAAGRHPDRPPPGARQPDLRRRLGLVGYCPGPALAALAVGGQPTLMFVGAMIAGMTLFEVVERLSPPGAERLRRHITPAGES